MEPFFPPRKSYQTSPKEALEHTLLIMEQLGFGVPLLPERLTEYQQAARRVEVMSDESLQTIWELLQDADPSEQYMPEVSMAAYTHLIQSERGRRGLSHGALNDVNR